MKCDEGKRLPKIIECPINFEFVIGFLTDVFLCVAQHLTFANLFSIFLGNSEPMNTLRQPLQQFVRDSVLKGAENTNSNLEAATRRLVDELWPDIQASLVKLLIASHSFLLLTHQLFILLFLIPQVKFELITTA